MSDYNPHSIDSKLSSIETKLDAALAELIVHKAAIEKLQAARYWLLGAAAAISFLAHKIFSLFTNPNPPNSP